MKKQHTYKQFFIAFFILFSFLATAQTGNTIVFGKIDSIESTILGEQRKVWVYVPEGAATNRYPVVYLLDGEGHFSSVVGMIHQLSSVNGNMICPKMIVVGIPNTDRFRDLTPTHVDSVPTLNSAWLKKTGGGEKFIAFIENEVMPFIESKYPTEPYKMFIGHSLGGLMVMQSLIHHPHLFNAYVAIDPSMWWDNQRLLKESKQLLVTNKFDRKSLFLGIANTMEDGMDLQKVRFDTTTDTRHIRSILELKTILEANKQNRLTAQSKYYENDTHSSAVLITEYDALHFIFDYYPLKISKKDRADTSAFLADKYEKHYANISKQLGYSVKPPEGEINGMGYQALGAKQLKKAESLFKLNIASYPKSANVYDSYGDLLLKKGETTNAIDNFKLSLTLQESAETRKKLDKLLPQSNTQRPLTAEELQKYVGEFVIEGESVTIKTFMRNGILMVLATDRPESELYATNKDEFKVKGTDDYILRFEMQDSKASAIKATAPEGTFTATLKK
jgi:uncharacterized protein